MRKDGTYLKLLYGRLGRHARAALDAAAGRALAQGHRTVEVDHLLAALLDQGEGRSDLAFMLGELDFSPARLSGEFTRALEAKPGGHDRAPALSEDLIDLLQRAWLLASLNYGAPAVRSGHLMLAVLGQRVTRNQLAETVPALAEITDDRARSAFETIATASPEHADTASAPVEGRAADSGEGAAPGADGALAAYCHDLTERAREGAIDPVLGRDSEIRQMTDILIRRRQNNPILTGEAGVGKTAVVEGLALRIAEGDVPEPLKAVRLLNLDLGLLEAGASMKGEFEERLRGVIDEVAASETPIILFIDEAHTLIGAGGAAGQGDAANLLKPALARGELRTIAATTWSEYKKYFEKDPALTRRFQVVKVEEPSEESAVEMMRAIAPLMERHHRVRVLDEACVQAVRLSKRYIPARQLPDKAVSLLDTASARVAVSWASTPATLEAATRRIDRLQRERDALARENIVDAAHDERLKVLEEELSEAETDRAALEARHQREIELAERYSQIRAKLEGFGTGGAETVKPEESASAPEAAETPADTDTAASAAPPLPDDRDALIAALKAVQVELEALREGTPMVFDHVDGQAIADVVANWTGIPVGKMMSDEIETIRTLKQQLEERIIGQSHALDAIAQSVRTARVKLKDPKKPVGVFLMVGTSGVGKTETTMALGDLLYGGEQNVTVINMSEFKEEHKVSLLMGSPPGYVGYGEGGVLTEAVRRRPHGIVLLDEMEKAHAGVQDVFYQVFDKGSMRDGEGRDIDFRNTMIVMTSNAGTQTISHLLSQGSVPPPEELADALRPELLQVFKPAFLGRLTLVPYLPLSDETLKEIVRLQLGRIEKRVAAQYDAAFAYDEAVVEAIAKRCTETDSGARTIDQILVRRLLPDLAFEFLSAFERPEPIRRVHIGIADSGAFHYEVA